MVQAGNPPDRLRALVTRAAGIGTLQDGIAWKPDRWAAAFPEHEAFLASLPAGIGRCELRALVDGGGTDPRDPEGAIRLFLAAMIWGFGNIGYGPYRTSRMLTDPEAGPKLARAAARVGEADAVGAYELMADGGECRLRGLGPAFGTKFLHFAAGSGTPWTAPIILDRFVAEWLREHAGVPWQSTNWHVATYTAYLDTMRRWALELDTDPERLEVLMFTDALPEGSQWANG